MECTVDRVNFTIIKLFCQRRVNTSENATTQQQKNKEQERRQKTEMCKRKREVITGSCKTQIPFTHSLSVTLLRSINQFYYVLRAVEGRLQCSINQFYYWWWDLGFVGFGIWDLGFVRSFIQSGLRSFWHFVFSCFYVGKFARRLSSFPYAAPTAR